MQHRLNCKGHASSRAMAQVQQTSEGDKSWRETQSDHCCTFSLLSAKRAEETGKQ